MKRAYFGFVLMGVLCLPAVGQSQDGLTSKGTEVDSLNRVSFSQFDSNLLDTTLSLSSSSPSFDSADFERFMKIDFQTGMADSTSFSTLPYRNKIDWKSSQNLGFDNPDFQRLMKCEVKRANWVDGIDERQTLRNQGFVVPDGTGVEFQLNKKD